MPVEASAKRYAQAIFQIASERNTLDEWVGDLTVVEKSLNNTQFLNLLDAPQIPGSEKIRVARNVLEKTVKPLAVNLVSLLSTRNLVHLVPNILKEYTALLDTHRGIERAVVTTAVQIDTNHLTKINEILEKISGNQIDISSNVDPQILGGLIAQIGDRVVDGSTRRRLQTMHRDIVGQNK